MKKSKIIFFITLLGFLYYQLFGNSYDRHFAEFLMSDYPEKKLYNQSSKCRTCKTINFGGQVMDDSNPPKCDCEVEKFNHLVNHKFSKGTNFYDVARQLYSMGMEVRNVGSCGKEDSCAFAIKFTKTKFFTEYAIIFEVDPNNKIINQKFFVWDARPYF